MLEETQGNIFDALFNDETDTVVDQLLADNGVTC